MMAGDFPAIKLSGVRKEYGDMVAVEGLDLEGKPESKYWLAVDVVQAGVGDRVLVLDEGNSARQVLGEEPNGPVRAVVVGVVDEVEVKA